jgi:hypothetical protein
VTVPGVGEVSFVQAPALAGESSSTSAVQKARIQNGMINASGAARLLISLRATTAGRAALAAHGFLKLKLTITFSPKDGRSASMLYSLTMRR